MPNKNPITEDGCILDDKYLKDTTQMNGAYTIFQLTEILWYNTLSSSYMKSGLTTP